MEATSANSDSECLDRAGERANQLTQVNEWCSSAYISQLQSFKQKNG